MSHGQGDGQETVFLWSTGDIRRTLEPRRPPEARASGRAYAPPEAVDPRRYPRLDLKIPILYRVVGGGVADIPASVRPALMAETRDLSPMGLCLSLEEDLHPGAILSLTIHLVEERERFEALARVVWSRPAGDGTHTLTGLQFVVVDGREVREGLHTRLEALVRALEA